MVWYNALRIWYGDCIVLLIMIGEYVFMDNLKIMTFNTRHCENFLSGKIDFHAVADAIKLCGYV